MGHCLLPGAGESSPRVPATSSTSAQTEIPLQFTSLGHLRTISFSICWSSVFFPTGSICEKMKGGRRRHRQKANEHHRKEGNSALPITRNHLCNRASQTPCTALALSVPLTAAFHTEKANPPCAPMQSDDQCQVCRIFQEKSNTHSLNVSWDLLF